MRCRFLVSLAALALVVGCGKGDRLKVAQRAATEGTIPTRVILSDFEDLRPDGSRTFTGVSMIPLSPFGAYYVERHDKLFPSNTQPFSVVFPRETAKRLERIKVFDSIAYYPPDQLPEAGSYDVAIKGTLNSVKSKGGISRYGLSFIGDIIWQTGLPNTSRRWEIDVDYQLVNAYTGEPISPVINATHTTSRKIFTKYSNRASIEDLLSKLDPVHDTLIDGIWKSQPPPSAPFWAQIREEGQQQLAEARRVQEQIVRGAPPVFSFISPANGSTVRTATVPVRWNITAPGGLKTALLVVNNQPVNLGLNPIDLASSENAPRSVAAQDATVPLQLGLNKFEVLVTDHRGNETRAAYELTRLPAALTPERRFALLIGAGSEALQSGAAPVSEVLTDPLLGQFPKDAVTVSTASRLSRANLESLLASFGRQPLSGDLAVIYLTTEGNWTNLALGDGSFTLNEFVTLVSTSIATNQVILLLDIDWSGSSEESLESRLSNLPATWAVMTPNSQGGAIVLEGNRPALANALVAIMKGESVSATRVTTERLLDELVATMSTKPGSSPTSFGRFTRSNTIVVRD